MQEMSVAFPLGSKGKEKQNYSLKYLVMELPYTKEKDIASFLVLQESFTTEEIRGAMEKITASLWLISDGCTGQQPASDQ